MSVKLFFSERSKYEHESEQLKEIYQLIRSSDLEKPIYIFTNFRLANSEIDCLILTPHGPVILDLKAYEGEIFGSENGNWIVKTDSGKELDLKINLFKKLQDKRFDFLNKLEPIWEYYFNRIKYEDIAKISSWGYFKKGSHYDEEQVSPKVRPWFAIVTLDTFAEKMRFVNAGYTLFSDDMDAIVSELNLTEYSLPIYETDEIDEVVIIEDETSKEDKLFESVVQGEEEWGMIMPELTVFEGNCPKIVSKDAKYSVRFWEGEYVVGIVYESADEELWYPVNEKHGKLVEMVNRVKTEVTGHPGGSFYINEFKQVIVPTTVTDGKYYISGEYKIPLQFVFENKFLSGDAINLDGTSLSPGDEWVCPHVGIPYILEAGAKDIRYEYEPRPLVKKKVKLSKYQSKETVQNICRMLVRHKGGSGGRFYINEFLHIFAPVDGEKFNYIYIGQLESIEDWFPKVTGENE